MPTVNMPEAEESLSRLVETGVETEIIIARNGRPVARLVPVSHSRAGQRIGVARGAFVVPDTVDAANDEIHRLFHGSSR